MKHIEESVKLEKQRCKLDSQSQKITCRRWLNNGVKCFGRREREREREREVE